VEQSFLISNDILFELEHLEFSYPDSDKILDNLNFTIYQGEAVSILGANGCGKSTLLKILSGLLSPTVGNFRAFGELVNAQMLQQDEFAINYHRQIGFIFQDSDVQLFCNSVTEELAFGLLQLDYGTDEIKQRIAEIAKLLKIEHLLNKTPYKLSGGEKKKVAIAAVLLLNPSVLILDEPSNALDPKTQHWLVGLLQQLHQAGKTLIISTHNLNLVSELSTRGILFNEQHQIVADAPIEQLLQQQDLLKQVNLI
jgi:cobalt/nickel transport system ATP-binding protein